MGNKEKINQPTSGFWGFFLDVFCKSGSEAGLNLMKTIPPVYTLTGAGTNGGTTPSGALLG